MNGKNYLFPWFMFRTRPTTTETKNVSVATEVAIIVLQAVCLALATTLCIALTLAATVAWSRCVEEVGFALVFGLSLIVVWAWIAWRGSHSEEAAWNEEVAWSEGSRRGGGMTILLALLFLLGAGAVLWGFLHILGQLPTLDAVVARWVIGAVGLGGVFSLGLAGIRKSSDRGWVFFLMLLLGGLVAVGWQMIPMWADAAWWPWVLTLLAIGVDAGSVLLTKAMRRELINPYEPLPPHEEIMLRWLEQTLEQSGAQQAAWPGPVLLNPPRSVPDNRWRRRFESFVVHADYNSSTEQMEQLGFKRRTEIEPWRDLLMRAGWARWKNPQSPQQGWELAAPPAEVLGAVGWPEEEGNTPPPSGM